MPRVNSYTDSGKTKWPQLYLGVAFTTLATLILELSLTRIFSVVFYYHFAFLAISIALFGLGAGGLFSYVVVSRGGNIFYKLGVLAVVNSITAALKKGQQVSVVGFGTFGVKHRAARSGRNPRTGETIQIAASNVPGFKAGKALKDAVN